MIYLIALLFLFSFGLNIYLLQKYRSQSKGIDYIGQKIQATVEEKKDDYILLYTSDSSIQKLLVQVNRLLEHSQQSRADYQKIDRSMKQMLSNISHDLRTPLTVVLGYVETIQDETLPHTKRNSLLKTIHVKTAEVIELMQRFFELVKFDAGDNELNVSKLNINEVCRQNILNFYELLTEKSFDVSIHIPEEPLYILGNEDAMNRILNNLIFNAIQHGADGKAVELRVKATDELIFIEVTDHGQGITELHKNHVFERMYTMEDSRNKQYQGSGLGLTITKRLVEQMRGNISLESIPYERTTFTVEFKRMMF